MGDWAWEKKVGGVRSNTFGTPLVTSLPAERRGEGGEVPRYFIEEKLLYLSTILNIGLRHKNKNYGYKF